MSHTPLSRAIATAVGISCTIGTAWIIIDEVPAWQQITPKHYLSMLILVIATFGMHRAIGDILQRNYIAALPQAAIAITALGLVMIVAGGRYSERAANMQRISAERMLAYAEAKKNAASAHADLERARAAHAARIAQADAVVDQARSNVRQACSDGAGSLCRGAQATLKAMSESAAAIRQDVSQVTAAEIAARVADQAAANAMPAKVTQSEGEAFARFLATIGLVSDEARAAIVLSALIPFALAVVVEIAGAACFVLAFPPKRYDMPLDPPSDPMPALRAVAAAVPLIASPVAVRADDVSQGVARLLAVLDAKHGKAMTVTQAAKAMKCCRPEASRRIKAAGDLVKTRKDGRFLYVTKA